MERCLNFCFSMQEGEDFRENENIQKSLPTFLFRVGLFILSRTRIGSVS